MANIIKENRKGSRESFRASVAYFASVWVIHLFSLRTQHLPLRIRQYLCVQYNGYLNLNGGSITRKSGTPTVKLKGPSIFLVYNNGSVNDITCDGAFAYIDGQANSTTITNSDNATCK